MQLPEHEKRAHREAFRNMTLGQKAEYIFAYYKLPLVLALVALIALGSVLNQKLTYKRPLLYVGMTNVSLDEESELVLTDSYVTSRGLNTRTDEVYFYRDLYLADAESSSDHQYSYASRLKLLASIDAEELDVVVMNQQAYDLLSHSGFLMDLTTQGLTVPDELASRLAANDVIVSDNELEVQLNEADVYEAVTEKSTNAFDVSDCTVFQNLPGTIYVGIVGNTPRPEEALAYIAYLEAA